MRTPQIEIFKYTVRKKKEQVRCLINARNTAHTDYAFGIVNYVGIHDKNVGIRDIKESINCYKHKCLKFFVFFFLISYNWVVYAYARW